MRFRAHLLKYSLKAIMRSLFILVSAFVLSASAFIPGIFKCAWAFEVESPGVDWTEAYRSDDLVIFTKDVEEGRKVLAVSDIEAPSPIIFKVLSDFGHYRDFMPYVTESRILEQKSTGETITYARIAPPFVSERDYPLSVRTFDGVASKDGVFKIEWTAAPDIKPEVKGVVRVRLNQGSWRGEPLDGGKRTRLTYTLLTNPGGLLPDFVLGLSNTIAIPKLFDSVRKRSIEEMAARK
jgi:hypothetical protein